MAADFQAAAASLQAAAAAAVQAAAAVRPSQIWLSALAGAETRGDAENAKGPSLESPQANLANFYVHVHLRQLRNQLAPRSPTDTGCCPGHFMTFIRARIRVPRVT